MLESKDLRLGNWIKWNDEIGAEVKVTGITETSISFSGKYRGEMEISKFTGIPITEEWLEKKAGAIKINHISGYSFWSFSKSKTNKCHIDWYDNRTLWMGHQIKHCKYIHELQNAFPFLKGEELTITN